MRFWKSKARFGSIVHLFSADMFAVRIIDQNIFILQICFSALMIVKQPVEQNFSARSSFDFGGLKLGTKSSLWLQLRELCQNFLPRHVKHITIHYNKLFLLKARNLWRCGNTGMDLEYFRNPNSTEEPSEEQTRIDFHFTPNWQLNTISQNAPRKQKGILKLKSTIRRLRLQSIKNAKNKYLKEHLFRLCECRSRNLFYFVGIVVVASKQRGTA